MVNFRLFGVRGREVLVLRAEEAREARAQGERLVREACINFTGLKVLETTSEVLSGWTGSLTPSDVFSWEAAWGRRFAKSQDARWR